MADGILTTCYGPAPYRRFAITLARCLRLHAPDTPRVVVTDAPDVPELRRHYDEVVPLRPELGEVFLQKLHLHRYTPFERTLYIDSDSLVVEPLDHVWEAFRGRPFGVVGRQAWWNHWFDPKRLPGERRHDRYPVFNGGLLYLGPGGGDVLDDAASMLGHYDEWGLVRNGDHVSDEPLISIAMACAGLEAVEDGGRIMRTLAGLQGPLRVDVFRAGASYRKYDEDVRPAVVHFAAGAWRQLEYRREELRLRLHERGVPAALMRPLPPLTRAALRLSRPLRRRARQSRSLAVGD